jgi:hypothetical protein
VDVDELVERAWKAVEKAGVSEAAQPTAFKEAVDFLRHGDEGSARGSSGGAPKPKRQRSSAGRSRRNEASSGAGGADDLPDENTFFAQLVDESGVAEQELRDLLQLSGAKVHVTTPARNLGTNASEQARTVIALVAGARSKGLNEKPVDAEAVRREANRKHCYDSTNFSGAHLRPMKGFNAGSSRNEIVLTSKWIDEFKEAVAKASGRSPNTGE